MTTKLTIGKERKEDWVRELRDAAATLEANESFDEYEVEELAQRLEGIGGELMDIFEGNDTGEDEEEEEEE